MAKLMRCLILLVFGLCLMAAKKTTIIDGVLSRAEIQGVLEKGPQAMVASVQVDPVMMNGRFVGFKLVSANAHSVLARSRTVMLGDVLVAINGHGLERPDQFMAAWESIAQTPQLSIRVLRGAEYIEFRWSITP
ncbi:MAG: hypothetical protein VYA30_05275 [Myxococcota bacterium]|nr:hypothetical protein [Myxococcota bacterium]